MAAAPRNMDPAALHPDAWYSKLAIHKVPATFIVATSLASYLILALAILQGAPNWLAFGLALVPWGVIIFIELEWVYEHFGWFTLFATMAVVQTIHYSEHCIEVVQVHIFGTPVSQAIAIFSALNVELVHFTGDTFLTIGTLLLLAKYPRNPWLWVAIPFQLAHQSEHTYLTYNYIFHGAKPGGVGLLGSPGGAIAGGIGLNRPDLHWIYNTLFTVPFVIALIWEAKHVYDRSLAEAFPKVSHEELLKVSKKLETFLYSAGETVLAPGDTADRLYIIADGTATVYRHDESGREIEIATLHRGQYFGEIGLLVPGAPHTKTVRASTQLRVLAMDKETFQELISTSETTGQEMALVAEQHMARVAAASPAAPVS